MSGRYTLADLDSHPDETMNSLLQDAREIGVDPNLAFRMFRQESGMKQSAVSPKGAFGRGQLMPDTAKYLQKKYGDDPHTPRGNQRLGLHYLKEQLDEFGHDRPDLAVSAYHAGPANVRKAGNKIPNTHDGLISTRDHVSKVVGGLPARQKQGQYTLADIDQPEISSSTIQPPAVAGTSPDGGKPSSSSGNLSPRRLSVGQKQEFGTRPDRFQFAQPKQQATKQPRRLPAPATSEIDPLAIQFEGAKREGRLEEARQLAEQLKAKGWEVGESDGWPYVKPNAKPNVDSNLPIPGAIGSSGKQLTMNRPPTQRELQENAQRMRKAPRGQNNPWKEEHLAKLRAVPPEQRKAVADQLASEGRLSDEEREALGIQVSGLRQHATDILGSAARGVTDIVGQIGAMGEQVPGYLDPLSIVAQPAEKIAEIAARKDMPRGSTALRVLADEGSAYLNRQQNIYGGQGLVSDVEKGIAGSLPIIAAGATGGGSLLTAGLGGLQTAAQIRQEAKAKGYSEQDATQISLLGIPVGFTEMWGIGGATNRYARGQMIRGFVTNVLKEAGEEATQENVQQALQNLIAKGSYDPEREIFSQDLPYQTLIAALTGGVTAGGLKGAERLAQRGSVEPVSPEIQITNPNAGGIIGQEASDVQQQPSRILQPSDGRLSSEAGSGLLQNTQADPQPVIETQRDTGTGSPLADPATARRDLLRGFRQPVTEPSDVAATVTAPITELSDAPDRRVDVARRRLVAEMSPDEMKRELLTSSTVDLPNRRAYDESEKKPVQVMSDADGLKAFNDKFGYDAGNSVLRAKAEALREAGLEAYHEKGDEFLAQGNDETDIRQRLEQARDILRNTVIKVTAPDGTVKQYKGLDFSYGIGQDQTAAEAGLKQHKAEREARGERARGELRGVIEVGATEGQQNRGDAAEREEIRVGSEVKHHSAYQPRRVRGAGKGQFKKGKSVRPEATPITDRDTFKQSIRSAFTNLSDEQISTLDTVGAAMARGYARMTGKSEGDFYKIFVGIQSSNQADVKGARKSDKGATEFVEDGRAIIHAFENADFSTAVHELGHVGRRYLDPGSLAEVEKWAGAKNGKWSRQAEEKFARGFERYLHSGKPPVPALQEAFAKIKTWMREVYKNLRGSAIDVKVSAPVARVFDRMLGAEEKQKARLLANQRARVTGQESLSEFIWKRGGVNTEGATGEMRRLREAGKSFAKPGFLNSRGHSLDQMREAANEAGYGPFERVNDFLDALENEGAGKPSYSSERDWSDEVEKDLQEYFGSDISEAVQNPEFVSAYEEAIDGDTARLEESGLDSATVADLLEFFEAQDKQTDAGLAAGVSEVARSEEDGQRQGDVDDEFDDVFFQGSTEDFIRVQAKFNSLKKEASASGRPLSTVVDDYLRQGGLFGHELNQEQQDLLRQMAAGKRKKSKEQQGSLFDTSPTLESEIVKREKPLDMLFQDSGSDTLSPMRREKPGVEPESGTGKEAQQANEYDQYRTERTDALESRRLAKKDRSGNEWKTYVRDNPQLRSNPDTVTVYRATVGDSLNSGDWVYLRKDLAEMHLENLVDRGEGDKARIIQQRVPLADILTGQDSTEFVYLPSSKVAEKPPDVLFQQAESKLDSLPPEIQFALREHSQSFLDQADDYDSFKTAMLSDLGQQGTWVEEYLPEVWEGRQVTTKAEPSPVAEEKQEAKPEINPDDYFNFSKAALSAEEEASLRELVSSSVKPTDNPKKRVTFDQIREEARKIDPKIIEKLKQPKEGQTLHPAVRLAARQRLNTLNTEAVKLRSQAAEMSKKGGSFDEVDELESQALKKEADAKRLIEILYPTRSQDGRNLVYHRILADSSWDAEHWISKARRTAARQGVDVENDKTYQNKEKEIAQTLGKGQIAEAREKELLAEIESLKKRLSEKRASKTQRRESWQTKLGNSLAEIESRAKEGLRKAYESAGRPVPDILYQSNTNPAVLANLVQLAAVKFNGKDARQIKKTFDTEMEAAGGQDYIDNKDYIYKEAYRLYQDMRKAAFAQSRANTVTGGKPQNFTQAQIDSLIRQADEAAKEKAQARRDLATAFARLEALTFRKKLTNTVTDILNAPRSLMSSVDLSAAGRQGFKFTLTEPKAAMKAGAEMVKGLVSNQARWDTFKDTILNHNRAKLAKRAGLYVSLRETEGDAFNLAKREESFASKLVGWMPHIKQSERAYVAYLDSIRLSVFDKYVAELEAKGLSYDSDPKAFQDIAKFINISTGRGHLGHRGEAIVKAIGPLLFSARYQASRLQELNPATYLTMDRQALKIVARKQAEYYGGIAAILGLASLAGASVNWDDPEDADWLKIKIGNTRYDILSGLQQWARTAIRTGKRLYGVAAGEEEKGQSKGKNAANILLDFGRSKLNPTTGYGVDWATGESMERDESGKRLPFSPGISASRSGLPTSFKDFTQSGIGSRMLPIQPKETIEMVKKDGWLGAAKSAPGFLGFGVMDYGERQQSGSRNPSRSSSPRRLKQGLGLR